jgi:hypothetical protein
VYRIEKYIPYPKDDDPSAPRRKRRSYPFIDMDIGDSFYFDGPEERGLVSTAACAWMRRYPTMRFSIRPWRDGYRCWRIAR